MRLVETLEGRIETIKVNLGGMIQYLYMKADEGDWHGVADAAMDIREMEAELWGLEQAKRY